MLFDLLFPGEAITRVVAYFKKAKPKNLADCPLSFKGLPPLANGQIIIQDLWGRNLKISVKSKEAFPLIAENPFSAKIETPFMDELQEDDFVYKAIVDLDDKVLQKIKEKIKSHNIKHALDIARSISRYRKVYSNIYGQAPMLPSANAIRTALVEKYLPKGAKILLIGDSDALSIILAKLGYKPFVVDSDEYVCWFLKKLAREFDVDVTVKLIDVRFSFNLDTRYDAFITDPEHTVACLSVFVIRGAQFTKRKGYGFISWESSFMQRRYLSEIIKRLKLKKINHLKSVLHYISPLKSFYEHMKTFKRDDIGFSIPKWKADILVVQKEKERARKFIDEEFVLSLY